MSATVTTGDALAQSHDHAISFGEATKVWARIAALSFGGPAGQIAIMHRIHTLFKAVLPMRIGAIGFDAPLLTSINVPAVVLAAGAALSVFGFKVGVIPVLLGCAGIGATYVLIV